MRQANKKMTQVQKGKLSTFRPQAENANAHTERGLKALSKAYGEVGYVAPMTAAANGEVIDGSARLEQAFEQFPDDALIIHHDGTRPIVMVRDDVENAEAPIAKKISYGANRIGEIDLQWDPEQVLADVQAGVDLSGLFYENELNDLIEGLMTNNTNEVSETSITETEAEKLLRRYDVKPGQVWRLGRHKIACLDSLAKENVIGLVGDNEVGMIWADPPYGISIVAANGYVGGGEAYGIPFGGVKNVRHRRRGDVGGGARVKDQTGRYPIENWRKGDTTKGLGSPNGAKPFGSKKVRGSDGTANLIEVGKYYPVEGDDTTETAIESATMLLKLYPKSCHIWWGGNYYTNVLPPSPCWIIWDKDNTGNFADCEMAWTNQTTAARIFEHRWNGMLKASEQGQRRVHPTQKPIALARWCFEKYGETNGVIFDPFLGSGISVLAAEEIGEGRQVIGCELIPEYIAVTLHRWSALTDQTPRLISE